MLKFWKKTGRKENPIGSASSSPTSTPRNRGRSQGGSSSSSSNGEPFFAESIGIDELERILEKDGSDARKSRLSKTLDEVVGDNEALAYFIQYLETVGHGALIKFVLDARSFDTAFETSRGRASPQRGYDALLTELVADRGRSGNASPEEADDDDDGDAGAGDRDADGDGEEEDASRKGCDAANGSDGLCNGDNGGDLKRTEMETLSRLLNSRDVSENTADAVKIYHKYFSHGAPLKIALDADVRRRLIDNLRTGVSEKTFAEAEAHVMKILEQEHFNDFLRSEFHCKYQIDVLTSNKVLISDILYNDTALFYFMEFLEQEGCTSLVEFWIAAYLFQQQYQERDQNYDPVEAQNDAMVLYDKYFSLQATNPLHLGDNVRIRVEESICKEEGPLPSCFDYPQRLIVKLLEMKYLQPFLQSQLYCKYLSELITTIQASPVLCSRSRNSGGSDCSSEVSISATNTLLACEDANPPKKIFRHLNSASMSIDTQQLYDPDSLWRRRPKTSGGLNFGRINELGRFVTDLEPEPDKKSESRITKAVKKFVHLDEDKSKEEMAWQVAAMIIKDVTNITMPPPPSAQT